MKVSIAMTTFNGGAYILDQLDSIRLQTRSPDEVIIFDDGSSDGTISIVEEYIEKWQLKAWFYKKTSKNVGWILNFYQCIEKTTGDIVFFCDQDDIWHNTKIEKMVDVLESNVNINVLACRLNLIDQFGKNLPINHSTFPFDSYNSLRVIQNQLNCKFAYSISPGCTIAVRKELIKKLNRYIFLEKLPHDSLYWKMATIQGTAFVLDEALIDYRIHSNNASSPSNTNKACVKDSDVRLEEASKVVKQMSSILKIASCLWGEKLREVNRVEKVLKFHQKRQLFLSGKYKYLIGLIVQIRYYRSFRMFIGDVASAIKGGL